jgi:Rps23 Pro-64 3,4-dihydroxylase Tpa1-like proline 4-hydroxylase
MSVFDYEAFDATPLRTDPFDSIVVANFVRPELLDAIARDYPKIEDTGSHPVESLEAGPAFQAFWKDVQSDEFRAHFEKKFGVDLTGHPMMATAREYIEATDGAIHTDSKTKVITILFYFNPEWPHEGGRLRFMRSPTDLEDYAVEVAPLDGLMLAFRVAKHSFHGHKPHAGHRRMVQVHWVDPKRIERNEKKRKSLRWRVKKLLRLG